MSEAESPLNQFIQQLAKQLSNKSADEIEKNLAEIFCRDCTFPMFVSPNTPFPNKIEMQNVREKLSGEEHRDLDTPHQTHGGGSDDPFLGGVLANFGGSDNPFPLDFTRAFTAFFGGSDTPFPLGRSVFALLICASKQAEHSTSKEEIERIAGAVKALHQSGIPVGAISWGFDNGNA